MTEFEFTLPQGYEVDGTVHREGRMRRATAADEILPLGDPRVVKNPAYLVVILLSRVVTRLGTLTDGEVNPHVVENLYATDLAYLQDLYNRINTLEADEVTCPHCQRRFRPEDTSPGG
jgi:hypothetical protein